MQLGARRRPKRTGAPGMPRAGRSRALQRGIPFRHGAIALALAPRFVPTKVERPNRRSADRRSSSHISADTYEETP